MVLKKEFNLEVLLTKNGWRILRFLISKSYLSFGLSELSAFLGISKSNILRYLTAISSFNLIKQEKTGRKKVYRINSTLELSKLLWQLFMVERREHLNSASKNTVDFIYNSVKDRVDFFILFGSVAYGLENEKSDIDILIIGDPKLKTEQFKFLPSRVEFHIITRTELEKMKDFVALDAIMNGVVYKGDTFHLLSNLRSFSKQYVLFRLQKAKEFLIKAAKAGDLVKKYYQSLAAISLGQIESLLVKKRILPKKLVRLDTNIKLLEELIRTEGDEIWLT